MTESPSLAYLWGEDAFGIEQAAAAIAAELSSVDTPIEVWRTSLDEDAPDGSEASAGAGKRRLRLLDSIEQHVSMAPLFGAGTLVVVRQPGGLLAESVARERLLAITRSVPHGNALCFADLIFAEARGPSGKGVLRDAVAALGGRVAEFPVPGRGRMEGWLVTRADQLGIRLEPGAARLLAERVGAHVREGDVDRRRQTQLANSELEKLSLYRPAGTVSEQDVSDLVSEAIPGSTWAFLDAVGSKDVAGATVLAERLLLGGTPLPVLIVQLHRRLRELISVREHLDSGTRPTELVRAMKLQPYRAQRLAEQAATWRADELADALDDLLALDLRSKGISLDGSIVQMSEGLDALNVQTWLARHAGSERAGRVASGSGAARSG